MNISPIRAVALAGIALFAAALVHGIVKTYHETVSPTPHSIDFFVEQFKQNRGDLDDMASLCLTIPEAEKDTFQRANCSHIIQAMYRLSDV